MHILVYSSVFVCYILLQCNLRRDRFLRKLRRCRCCSCRVTSMLLEPIRGIRRIDSNSSSSSNNNNSSHICGYVVIFVGVTVVGTAVLLLLYVASAM